MIGAYKSPFKVNVCSVDNDYIRDGVHLWFWLASKVLILRVLWDERETTWKVRNCTLRTNESFKSGDYLKGGFSAAECLLVGFIIKIGLCEVFREGFVLKAKYCVRIISSPVMQTSCCTKILTLLFSPAIRSFLHKQSCKMWVTHKWTLDLLWDKSFAFDLLKDILTETVQDVTDLR